MTHFYAIFLLKDSLKRSLGDSTVGYLILHLIFRGRLPTETYRFG